LQVLALSLLFQLPFSERNARILYGSGDICNFGISLTLIIPCVSIYTLPSIRSGRIVFQIPLIEQVGDPTKKLPTCCFNLDMLRLIWRVGNKLANIKVVELVGQRSKLVRQLLVSSCWPTSCQTN